MSALRFAITAALVVASFAPAGAQNVGADLDAPERFVRDMQAGLEDEFLDRAVVKDLGGTAVPVIDRSDLLIAKLLAGRPKDTEDVRALWRLHGSQLDATRIRRTLQLLEEALSQSDLVSAFDVVTRSTSGE